MAHAPDVDLKIPVGDLTPALQATLKDGDDPQNLTNINGVTAYFQKWRSSEDRLEYECSVASPESEGVVEITWNDTDTIPPPAGLYRLWFVVEFDTGLPQSFPQERDLLVEFWTHGQG